MAKRTLQIELDNFTDFVDLPRISKQALSQARKKLSPKAFTLLNDKLITEFYTDNEISTFKGYRVLAIDGSTVQLPESKEIIKKFGKHKNQIGEFMPIARTSILFDVLNKLTIHSKISPETISERHLALQHIDHLGKTNHCIKDLLLFDRGYPSTELIFTMKHKKIDFLMRCNKLFRSQINEASEGATSDQIITLDAFYKKNYKNVKLKQALPYLKKNDSMKIRVLTFMLASGEKEILITSLLNQEEFTPDILFHLYAKRWDVEENYKMYKSIVEIDNFSGKSNIAIEQDFYATVLTSNIISLLIQEAQREVEEQNREKNLKYEYKINKNVSVGTLKNEIIVVLLTDINIDDYCEKLKNRIKRYIVPIRPNRTFPRLKTNKPKYPTNQRRAL